MNYPDRHHPCYFLADALTALGHPAEVIRNHETLNCWGLRVGSRIMVWLIDNRWAHEAQDEDPAAKELMARGVLVCHAQKPDQQRVGGHWLPLAATPGYLGGFVPEPEKRVDAAFVGYVRDAGRSQMLIHLAGKARVSIQQGVFGADALHAYQEAVCGVNIPTRYGEPNAYDSANMRLFEIAAAGRPVVTAHEDYLSELGFINNVNCLTYQDGDDLVDAVMVLKGNAEMADTIGVRGHQLILERHTYAHRAKQVLEWLR